MSAVKQALLLNGSPRQQSNSAALLRCLERQLAERQMQVTQLRLQQLLRHPDGWNNLLDALAQAELIVLAFPLYVDSLPAPVIRTLERWADHRRQRADDQPKYFAALANCGFPEARHNQEALEVCANFALAADLNWLGGLGLGAGGMLNGRSPQELGAMMRSVTQALQLAAAALAAGQPIPAEARQLMGKPLVPAMAYRLAGDYEFKQAAGQNGVLKQLKRRPYAD